MININERIYFSSIFNRGGYVLDFSTPEFNNFTRGSIGIELCEKYKMSKGKSLDKFIEEGEIGEVIKLLNELLVYYETHYFEEIKNGEISDSGLSYEELFKKCKQIIDRQKNMMKPFNMTSEELKKSFSSDYMNIQIDLMNIMCNENPTEAIGKAKELIESCCKLIMHSEDEEIEVNITMSKLVKKTLKILEIPNNSINMDQKEEEIIRQITGSLNGLLSGIVDLRNHYGSGHGRVKNFQGLSTRHAQLAVGSSITLVQYLWNTFLYRKDCQQIS